MALHWAAVILSLAVAGPLAAGKPGYEPAYYNGITVIINAIEVKQNPTDHAQADFYEVAYPIGWQSLGIGTPQCNPCDHEGNGIDFTDYHDHILDSIPSSPGHGEFSPLWHVFVVIPAYTGNAAHNALVTAAYAAHIPTTSEGAVDALVAATLPDGSPVAIEIDTHFYFLCVVVNPHAATLMAPGHGDVDSHQPRLPGSGGGRDYLASRAWRVPEPVGLHRVSDAVSLFVAPAGREERRYAARICPKVCLTST